MCNLFNGMQAIGSEFQVEQWLRYTLVDYLVTFNVQFGMVSLNPVTFYSSFDLLHGFDESLKNDF